MPKITIGSEIYTVYADVAAADLYAAGAMGAGADKWRNAEAAIKERALISATRTLERQKWQSGYDAFDKRVAVTNIVNASIEIAFALLNKSSLETATTGQTKKRVKAEGVEIEYFRGAEGPAFRFPRNIHELLLPYMGGTGTMGPVSAGVDRASIFPIGLGFSKGM